MRRVRGFVFVMGSTLAGPAAADVYWTSNTHASFGRPGGVYRANDDGTGQKRIWIGGFATGLDAHNGVLAWSTIDGKIYTADIDGNNATQIATIDSNSNVYGVSIAGDSVYVVNSGGNTDPLAGITRVALDGSSVERIYDGAVGKFLDTDRARNRLVYTTFSSVHSRDLDGSNRELIASGTSIRGLSIDDETGSGFFMDNSTIHTFAMPSATFLTYTNSLRDFAISESAGMIFHTDGGSAYGYDFDGTQVFRTPFDTETEQIIHVVPAPGGAAVLALGVLARRRR